MKNGIFFNFAPGTSPYIAVMEVVAGSITEFFVEPGREIWGVKFEDMARAGHGMLIMVSPTRARIVANDDWPPNLAAGAPHDGKH